MTREEVERIAGVAFDIFMRDGRRITPDKSQIYLQLARATVAWLAARNPTAPHFQIVRETVFELVRNAPLPKNDRAAGGSPYARAG